MLDFKASPENYPLSHSAHSHFPYETLNLLYRTGKARRDQAYFNIHLINIPDLNYSNECQTLGYTK